MTYAIKIDMTAMRESLAQIEQGNPVRHATTPTLYGAVQLCNMARMAAGLPMVKGPRNLAVGQCVVLGFAYEIVECEIQRLQPKGRPCL